MSHHLETADGHFTIEFEISRFDFTKLEQYLARKNVGDANDRIKEFKRFMTLKALYRDVTASILSPSYEVDQVWHGLLQFPLDYIAFCDAILPLDSASRIIDHDPFGGDDVESQSKRYQKTLEVYKLFFRQDPPSAFWEAPEPLPNTVACVVAPRVEPEPNPVAQVATLRSGSKRKTVDPIAKSVDSQKVKVPRRKLKLTLFVKTLTDKTLTVQAMANDSIQVLNLKIQEQLQIPAEQQRLIFAGRQLEDGPTLESFNLKDGSTIHLYTRLRGC